MGIRKGKAMRKRGEDGSRGGMFANNSAGLATNYTYKRTRGGVNRNQEGGIRIRHKTSERVTIRGTSE
jgi:hypothetical protein